MIGRVCKSRPRLLLAAVFGALVVSALVAVLVLRPWTGPDHPRYLRAAVAANGYECAAVGRSILEKGGSAVDAAIAALFCEGISCAQCMGLGGGFLATIYDAKTRQVRVLNARERAPAAAHKHMYDHASPTVGALAMAVPGELRGYGMMHREYGSLPWEQLVEPTAELCRKGHRVTEYMGRVLNSYSDRIKAEPSMRELYVNPETGETYNEGDMIKEPIMARTLDVIAKEGAEAIHNGSLTEALVRDIQTLGGIITKEDLNNYRAEWQDPISVRLGDDFTLFSVPLPGSGSVLAFILNMLQGWVGDFTDASVGSNLYWHRIIETFKYAYAKRTGLGDPAHPSPSDEIPFSIDELNSNLSTRQWAEEFRSLVDDAATNNDWHHYGALFEGPEDHGTAHVVVVSTDGSAVSVTSTINYIWGCQRRSTSLGIMLNNEMDDFAIPNTTSAYGMPPSPANMLAPGMQPLSSMTPSIVLSENGTVHLVLGAAGGTKITTQVALASLHMMVENENVDVIQKPRVHHQLMPMHVDYEEDYDPKIIASLKARGHTVNPQSRTAGFAALVAIKRDSDGYLVPQTDKRRIGSIDGF